jgi:beta-N-acetylhexosaminidase
MSLWEKLCQMLILRPGDLGGGEPVTAVDESIRRGLAETPVGGFFLDAGNMEDSDQLRLLTAELKAASPILPLILCDEEGGTVSRLMRTVGTTQVGAMYSYRNEGPEKAFSNAEIIAGDLTAHGLNGDLAPVADVWSNPDNPVIRTRAYSDDFAQAAELVAAAVEGFHAGGVACTLKHFPGHGDTASDSHYGAAYVTKSLEELRKEELLPFLAGIEAGADMVMIGHLTVPALDEAPAPFSHAVVTELLREELGFTGVVVTDALEMGALGDYTSGESAVLAVQAGVDLLLCPGDPAEALRALSEAVKEGELSRERIDESVLRILRMKLRFSEG